MVSRRLFSAVIIMAFILSNFFILRPHEALAVTRTWDGGGATNNWSEAANWSGDTAPGASDDVIFDATSTKDSTINSGHGGSVRSITISSGYTGTITQARTVTVGAGGYSQADGTFTGASQTVTMNGPFTLSNGTFTSTTSTLIWARDVTISGGTFAHNSGTVRFAGTSNTNQNVDVPTSLNLNNLDFSTTAGNFPIVRLASGDTLNVPGNLNLFNGYFASGTIEYTGTSFVADGRFDGGEGIIHVTSAVTISPNFSSSSIVFPGLNLDNAGASIPSTTLSTQQIRFGGDLTLTNGTFDVGPGTLLLRQSMTQTGGTFTSSSASLSFGSDSQDLPDVHILTGDFTFAGLIMVWANATDGNDNVYRIHAGNTLTITGKASSIPYYPYPLVAHLTSDSAGVAANLSLGTGSTLFNTSIQDINQTNGTITCGAHCTDLGNNTGFTFGIPDVSVGAISDDTVLEGAGLATFSVVLTGKPTANVTIPVSSTDTGEATVGLPSLVFTSSTWSTPQTVNVMPVDDTDDDGAQPVTITLGAITSADSRFNGLNPSDVSLTIVDDDTDANVFDFEESADWATEDLRSETSPAIAWFTSQNFGAEGNLLTGSSGANVNISGTKIQTGCKIVIGGSTYTIGDIYDATTGDISIQPDSSASPDDIEALAISAAVTDIHCAEPAPSGAELIDDDATLEKVTGLTVGSRGVYDSTNNALWTISSGNILRKFSLPAVTASSTYTYGGTISQFNRIAYDSTHNRIWASASNGTLFVNSAVDASLVTSYAVGASTSSGNELVYDATNDAIWYMDKTNSVVYKVNAANGTVLATISLSTSALSNQVFSAGNPVAITHDAANNSVWVLANQGFDLVEIDAATGAFEDGTYIASSIPTNLPNYSVTPAFLTLDPVTGILWMSDMICSSTYPAQFVGVNAASRTIIHTSNIPDDVCPGGSVYDALNSRIVVTDSSSGPTLNTGGLLALSTANPERLNYINTLNGYDDFVIDSAGTMYELDGSLVAKVSNVNASGEYYTVASDASGQIDTSSWGSVTGVAVDETLNGQDIFYSVSFDDRHTWKVFDAWRSVASDLASVHGGTDGVWYYIDDADVWHAAPIDSEESALSAAMENGPLYAQLMDGAALAGLTSSEWSTAGGFSAGTLDLAATFTSSSRTASSTVRSVTFTAGAASSGGGGGGGAVFVRLPEDAAFTIDSCTATRDVGVLLSAQNASQYVIAVDGSLDTESWQSFEPNTETDDGIPAMRVMVTLPNVDGDHRIYVKFRSSTGNTTETISGAVLLDQANACMGEDTGEEASTPEEPVVEQPEVVGPETPGEEAVEGVMIGCLGIPRPITVDRTTSFTAPSPITGKPEPVDQVYPGDYIRAVNENLDTVYCIDKDLHRRPFMDEITYFTFTRTFSPVVWVTDATLSTLEIGPPMLPKIGVTLMKFPSSPEVYRAYPIADDPSKILLRPLLTEEVAAANYGPLWRDYVIDINETLRPHVVFGDPIIDIVPDDVSAYRKRALLNELSRTIMDHFEGMNGSFAPILENITSMTR